MILEDKIIISIERLTRICRCLMWDLGKTRNLTPLQIQILIHLGRHSQRYCSITALSLECGVTKPTVSGSVQSLKRKNLVQEKLSSQVKRARGIFLTPQGKKIVKEVSCWDKDFKEQLRKFPDDMKNYVLIFFMELIASLKETGIIQTARMCMTCERFSKNIFPKSEHPHYCKLLDKPIATSDLNLDCEKHLAATKL